LSSIDASGRESLALTIKRVQKQTNTTSVYVTHSSEEARLISDRVAIMYDGKIQQIAKYSEIDSNPKNYLVAKIMGTSNVWQVMYKEETEQGDLLHLPIGEIQIVSKFQKKITGVRIRENAFDIILSNKEELVPNLIKGKIRTILEQDEETSEVIVDVLENPSEYIKVHVKNAKLSKELKDNSKILLKIKVEDVVFF